MKNFFSKKRLTILLLLLTIISLSAQDYKFGKVSKEELTEKFNKNDSTAVATVLYREYKVIYDYDENLGFKVITKIHERIKIYNKDGFDYATIKQSLFKNDNSSEKEILRGLKALTYNLVEGEIVESKLKSSDTFKEEVSDYYDQEKFTMPNVKEGSVIEYKYIHESPFSYNIDEIKLQYYIPIKKQLAQVEIPEFFYFKPRVKGYLPIYPKESKKSGKINFMSGATTSSVDFVNNISSFDMTDVPALKEEPYVNNMENYRAAVKYELQYIQYPNSIPQNYTTTWEKVAKTIYDSSNFGKQLSQNRYYKDVLPTVIANASTEIEKTFAIFSFVQQHMNWNGSYGKYTNLGVKTAFKEQSGNVADINLMLVGMLNGADLEAYPVLVSTRDNGVPLFPTREGFNYVIASVKIKDQMVLLDATNKFSEPNMLPQRALNWYGRLIGKTGESVQIPLSINASSKEAITMQVNLLEDGSLEGKMRCVYSKYNAYHFRNNNSSISEDDYLDKLETSYGDLEVSDYKVTNHDVLGKPITESFSFELSNHADVIGDKLYFSPAFFKATTKNPFKLEERNYPIDFVFPWNEKMLVNINIPEGYKIESLPESKSIALPDGIGVFTFNLKSSPKGINLMINTSINQAVIGSKHYDGLKEFFKLMVEKESEKVVLSKI